MQSIGVGEFDCGRLCPGWVQFWSKMGWVGLFLVENDGLSAQTVRVLKGFDLVVVKGSVWGFKGKRWLEKSSIKGFRRLGLQFWGFWWVGDVRQH